MESSGTSCFIEPFLSRSTHSFGRVSSPRFQDRQPHFLEVCSLCNNHLADNRDIFMYRGDTPFCSEECRQEQIDIDEAMEKNRKLSSMKAMRKEHNSSASQSKSQNYSFRTGAVAAA